MGDFGNLKRLTDRIDGRLQTKTGVFTGGQYRRLGHWQAEEIAHQGRRSFHRHHVVMGQMNHRSQDARPVL